MSPRRYEHPNPGDLVHIDVKKVGRIPDGGGWRAHGRGEQVKARGIGYDYIHTAIDDHSRLAYAEILPDEKGNTTAAFLARAIAWFAEHGVTVKAILSDSGAEDHGPSTMPAVGAVQAGEREPLQIVQGLIASRWGL